MFKIGTAVVIPGSTATGRIIEVISPALVRVRRDAPGPLGETEGVFLADELRIRPRKTDPRGLRS